MMFNDICANLLERTDRAPLINGHAVKIGEIYKVVPSKNIAELPGYNNTMNLPIHVSSDLHKYAKDFSFIHTNWLGKYVIWLEDSGLPLIVKPIRRMSEALVCRVIRGADMKCAAVLNNMSVRPLSVTIGNLHPITQNQRHPMIPLAYNNGFVRYTKEEQAATQF